MVKSPLFVEPRGKGRIALKRSGSDRAIRLFDHASRGHRSRTCARSGPQAERGSRAECQRQGAGSVPEDVSRCRAVTRQITLHCPSKSPACDPVFSSGSVGSPHDHQAPRDVVLGRERT